MHRTHDSTGLWSERLRFGYERLGERYDFEIEPPSALKAEPAMGTDGLVRPNRLLASRAVALEFGAAPGAAVGVGR